MTKIWTRKSLPGKKNSKSWAACCSQQGNVDSDGTNDLPK